MRVGSFEFPRMYAVHGAAGLVGFAIVALLIHGAVNGDVVPSCSERYNQGTVYGLETRSGLITTGELQAGLAGRDFGVMENLDIIRFNTGPAKSGLRVRLAQLERADLGETRIDNGIDFGWSPRKMPNAKTACLTYSVRIPEGFKPGDGGHLPSLVGAPSDIPGEARSVTTQMMWNSNGELMVDVKSEPLGSGTISATAIGTDTIIPTGKWVRIEQEVILNTPGLEDGEVRIWIDGVMRARRRELYIRRDPKTVLNGVGITVAYIGSKSETTKAEPTAIEVSPFEVRWP